MDDNVDLLVERLHALILQLLDPAYCGHEPRAVFSNKAAASQILVAMYGGFCGSNPVPPAVDPRRQAQYLTMQMPVLLGRITSD